MSFFFKFCLLTLAPCTWGGNFELANFNDGDRMFVCENDRCEEVNQFPKINQGT